MEIINCETATRRIHEALLELSLDELARETSRITNVPKVIVINDCVEIFEDTEKMLLGLVEDSSTDMSDVYADGILVGYVDEKGIVQEFEKRYEAQKPLGESDFGTMQAHIDNSDLVPIYDADSKKIICYAIKGEEDRIIKALDF